jgi:predicted ester cyclase
MREVLRGVPNEKQVPEGLECLKNGFAAVRYFAFLKQRAESREQAHPLDHRRPADARRDAGFFAAYASFRNPDLGAPPQRDNAGFSVLSRPERCARVLPSTSFKQGETNMSILEHAKAFFDASETGKGWEVCREWCVDGATFSCQADSLADITTLDGYTEWTKNILVPIPDGHYELKAFAADEERKVVLAFAVFHGTQSGEGGPVPPTGKKVAADYVYAMSFEGDKIRHMTKIWNDVHSLKQLGWA